MTVFAGLDLRRGDGSPGFGASFVLRSPAPGSRTLSLDGWTVDVIQGAKVVVARGPHGVGYSTALNQGLEAADRGLDLLCAMSAERHLIENAAQEHLAWWPNTTASGLNVAAMAEIVTSVRGGPVVLTVTDVQGNLAPPTRGPNLSWHPS